MVKALTRLLKADGFTVRGFTSAKAFLKPYRAEELGCLVLDVAMPELNGLDLQRRFTHAGIMLPIVFLTGHGDIPMSVQAVKAGAVDFLTKPVNDADLLRAVRAASPARRRTTRLGFTDRPAPAALFQPHAPRGRGDGRCCLRPVEQTGSWPATSAPASTRSKCIVPGSWRRWASNPSPTWCALWNDWAWGESDQSSVVSNQLQSAHHRLLITYH